MYSSTHSKPQNWGGEFIPQPLYLCGGGETSIHGMGGWVGARACQQLYMLIQNTKFRNFLTSMGDRNKSIDDGINNIHCGGCFTPKLDIF